LTWKDETLASQGDPYVPKSISWGLRGNLKTDTARQPHLLRCVPMSGLTEGLQDFHWKLWTHPGCFQNCSQSCTGSDEILRPEKAIEGTQGVDLPTRLLDQGKARSVGSYPQALPKG
jgi:hypothetical protein